MALAAYCTNCGTANTEGHRFCPRCGQNLVGGPGLERPAASAVPAQGTPLPAPAAAAEPPVPPGAAPPGRYVRFGYLQVPARRVDAVSIFLETFRAWSKDLPAYLGIFLVYGLGTVGILLATTWSFIGTPYPTTNFLLPSISSAPYTLPAAYFYVLLGTPILNAILGVVFTATVTYYSISKRRGARVPWSTAFRAGVRGFRSVLLGALVAGLLVNVFLVLELLPYVVGIAGPFSPVLIASECGLLLVIVPVLFLTISLSLYAPEVMLEGAGAVASLRRSWSLTRGHRLTIFGADLIVGGIAAVIVFAATLSTDPLGNPFISTAAQLAATAITGSWSVLLAAVAYELIEDERRDQARQAAAMAWLPRSALPGSAPAYLQPGAPACPACGASLLWVPAYGRWYCGRCGAYR